MNFKRAFKALWEEEPVSETGIPESELLLEEISHEKPELQKARFIPHNAIDPVKELIASQNEN